MSVVNEPARADRISHLSGVLYARNSSDTSLGGWSLAEHAGCKPGDPTLTLAHLHPEDRAALEALFEHLRQQADLTVARLDVRVQDEAGAWQWCEAVASSLTLGDGTEAIHLQWRDAPHRGTAGCAECATTDGMQLIAEASDDIIGVTNGHRQTLYASPALARITGYTLEEIQASDFSGRVHPADAPLIELARQLNLRGQRTRIEYRYRCKNGEYVWLDSQATPVVGPHGRVDRIVLTTREITLRKAAERDARRLEGSWRTLIHSAADIVELIDPSGIVLYANRARPGRQLAEVIGAPLTRGLSPQASQSLTEALHSARSNAEPVDVEWEWAPPGQAPAWFWSRITPLATAARSERLVSISRDVTERRRQIQACEMLPMAARGAAQQITGLLVTALDRLTALNAVLAPGSKADAALVQAQGCLRSAAALAGKLAALAEPADSAGSRSTLPAAESARPACILLVDDDESVRASLLALLRARGLRVVAAADGQEAIDLFLERAEEIDAVVLDQNMPAMNGTSVLRELRAIRPNVKVVISSGDLMEAWDTQVDECNRLAFAQKALGPQELLAQLQRLLQRKL